MRLFDMFCDSYQEYHWFLRRSFRDRIQNMYLFPSAESHDRNWLCKLSVFLALGETLNSSFGDTWRPYGSTEECHALPGIRRSGFSQELPRSSGSPPGAELFEQGLRLLKVSYEEPCIEQVEALNLIVRRFLFNPTRYEPKKATNKFQLGLLLLQP